MRQQTLDQSSHIPPPYAGCLPLGRTSHAHVNNCPRILLATGLSAQQCLNSAHHTAADLVLVAGMRMAVAMTYGVSTSWETGRQAGCLHDPT